jgi:hypothetical protein
MSRCVTAAPKSAAARPPFSSRGGAWWIPAAGAMPEIAAMTGIMPHRDEGFVHECY